jgi:TPR repeat protein
MRAYRAGDLAAARDLWQKGCDAGRAKDCYELGIVYRDGEGVAPDPQRYAELMARACDGKIASACHNLGRGALRAVEEEGAAATPQQLETGIGYYRRGCQLGLPMSCSNLGLHLAREAVKGDPSAVEGLRQSCIEGAGAICFGLASLYDIHLGAKLGDDPDAANAALLLGCERFDRDSCQNLAWHYDHGFGLETNRVRGSALYHLACDDDPGFICPMVPGSAVAAQPDRKAPVSKELQRAAGAYRAACDDGLAMGCFGYARLVARSGGGASDTAVIRNWLEKALTLSPEMPIATELMRRLDAGELPKSPIG